VGIKSIVVGSRGSKLALLQTELVIQRLKKDYPELDFRVRQIRTKGDSDRRSSLSQMGVQGIFVKELEEALISGEIDIAVHSLKDMPTDISPEFRLAAVGMRIDARDAFVSKNGDSFTTLPQGAIIGTGSERRAVQMKSMRSDIRIRDIRGNIDTRLKKLYSGEYDGIIVAAAALLRMGLKEKIAEYLPINPFLPSVGQGALAVEIEASNKEMYDIVSNVNEEQTWQCVQAERAFLSTLGGGCRTPIAALGTFSGGLLHLEGMVADREGTRILRDEETGAFDTYVNIGRSLARKLLSMGAGELLLEKEK